MSTQLGKFVAAARRSQARLSESRMFVFVEETECQAALTDWLLKYGEKTYYDRLSRALQHIGRTDIAIGENYTKAEHKLMQHSFTVFTGNM